MTLSILFYVFMLVILIFIEGHFDSVFNKKDIANWRIKYGKDLKKRILILTAIYSVFLVLQLLYL